MRDFPHATKGLPHAEERPRGASRSTRKHRCRSTQTMTTATMIPATPMKAIRGVVTTGVAAVAIFVIAGGVWSAFAPLESAAVGPGQVEAESFRKRIEHLEGGIIGQILVHDGGAVEPGQVLVRLDDTKARTTLF